MALLQECPKCKSRLSMKRDECCGIQLHKISNKVYWIEFYENGKRKRERVGPSKKAAQQRLREVLKLRTEERYIDKDPSARLSLGDLCSWYLNLPEVKKKDSYKRDVHFIIHLKRLLGEGTKIKDITPGKMESYQRQRLDEPSKVYPGKNTTPCEVNKEITCLKIAFNKATKHRKLKINPISQVKRLPENNIRQRILSHDEFKALLDASEPHLRPVLEMAYTMGMRRDEIVKLRWSEVDLKQGFIRLPAERTKTNSPRNIPIHPRVKEILERLPRPIHTDRVFLRYGQPFDEIKHSFKAACKRAGIEDFRFHDLRHCALNNLRQAGNDFFQIMALSGHKTMSVFKRYNLVTENELKQIKWPSLEDSKETSLLSTMSQ